MKSLVFLSILAISTAAFAQMPNAPVKPSVAATPAKATPATPAKATPASGVKHGGKSSNHTNANKKSLESKRQHPTPVSVTK